jgi:hypothetical protein
VPQGEASRRAGCGNPRARLDERRWRRGVDHSPQVTAPILDSTPPLCLTLPRQRGGQRRCASSAPPIRASDGRPACAGAICRETGAGLLLDVENLHLNASNHGFDAYAFLDALPDGLVKEIHLAGGKNVSEPFLSRPLLVDSHSYPVPEEALSLLDYALTRQRPAAIVLERDYRLEETDEILADLAAIRAHVAAAKAAA